MTKRSLAATVATILSFGLGLPAVASADPSAPVVYVGNLSTVVPQADLEAALPAFQTAVTRDFAPVWGVNVTLTTDPAAASTAAMVVNVEDYSPVFGALGYHDVIGRRPTSRVFAATGASYNESWQLTFTHELFEMLADPWINHFAIWNGRTWLVEVADQVESGFYAYTINGVVISDFVTPRWYNAKLRGPFDFTRKLKRAGQIGRHGYASYWAGGGWQQVFG